MEEEGQELKHVCKLCNKTFPCGRSLGGHMRSHVINSAESDPNLTKKKLPSLRENPKRAFRFTDSNGEALLHNKLCKECGRGFQSWKALFGHMKCHSERFSNTNVEEEDSWTSSASQSDNPKERSSRRGTRTRRYIMGNANSLNIANNINNASSSSVSVIEQDQEEVARCLIMLSKDLGNKRSGWNSVDESSDNNFELLQPKSSIIPRNLKSSVLGCLSSKFDTSGVSRNGLLGNDHKTNKGSKLGKNFMKERRRLDQSAELSYGDWGSGKRSKFECTTCNKTFHSYQALGGHRASHKKIKGCSFASKIDSTAENSTEETAEISPAPPKSHNNEGPIDEEEEESYVELSKQINNNNNNKGGGHECPICFKVFSSGQALGGHKRSHLICGGGPQFNQTIVIHQKPNAPEIRDLLDLNLPAPAEEDESSSGFKPWWVADNLKHDQLFGLLS